MMNRLRNLDAYPKINEDFYRRTLSGGVITLVSSIIMLILFFSELQLYIHPVTETRLRVDTARGEKLRINFDVTFPALQCSIISLDSMDISGERHLDVRHDIIKRRLDSSGNVIEAKQDGIGHTKIEKPLQKHGGRLEHNETYCGSCFGAEKSDDACCNSCEEVRKAYRKKGWALSDPEAIDQCKTEGYVQKVKDEEGEGCNVHGFLEVNKVAGNFHFIPGQSFHQSGFQFHDTLLFQQGNYNISHTVNRLAFGDFFPGVVNPLDGVHWDQGGQSGMYQYFIKVVPSIYTDVHQNTIQSNQVLKDYGTWIGAGKDHWCKKERICRRRPNHRPTGRWFCPTVLHHALEKWDKLEKTKPSTNRSMVLPDDSALCSGKDQKVRRPNHRPTGRWFCSMVLHYVLEKTRKKDVQASTCSPKGTT